MSTNATRVVLADDEILMREGLAGLLERSGFEVAGQSGNASALIELVREPRVGRPERSPRARTRARY